MIVIDARGHQCPVPSLKLRRALEGQAAGARATLLATDPMARIDVPFLMSELNGQVVEITESEGVIRITVENGGAPTD